MRKFLTFVVIGSMVALGMPSAAFAAPPKAQGQQIQFGTVSGMVRSANGDPLPNHKVRSRDAAGNIVGQATSNAAGSFSIAGLQPGNYIIELVNSSGQVIGVSSPLTVASGETISVTVTATAASKGAVAAAAGGGFSLFGLGTAASIGVIAAASTAAIVGIVAATNNNNASPSK